MVVKVFTLVETSSHEPAKGEKKPDYKAVQKDVYRVVAQRAINVVIHVNFDNLFELQDFVQHIMSNLTKNVLFKVPIIYLLKLLAQVAVADDASFMTKVRLAPIKMNMTLHRRP